jgi:hypothetical protein
MEGVLGWIIRRMISQASAKIVEELEKRFVASKVMDALGIFYPQ